MKLFQTGTNAVSILDIERHATGGAGQEFGPDGRFYASENQDGTVSVFDIEEAQRKLTEIGMAMDIASGCRQSVDASCQPAFC